MSENDVRPVDREHASIAPLYATVSPDNPNSVIVVCSYKNRSNEPFADIFLVDKTKEIRQQLDLIEIVAGGGLFRHMEYICTLGSHRMG